MKKMHLYSTEGSDTSLLHAAEQDSNGNSVYMELQYALTELVALKQSFAASQTEIEILRRINSCQKRKLIRLARKLAQAHYLGYYDELTSLPNRRLLLNRLKQAMAQSDRQHKQIALLFIDVDKFKRVNDRFGHETGDKLLQQLADRLINCIRYGDTACRYGGDEFVIMLPEIDGMEDAVAVAKKICVQLSMPYLVDGTVIKVSASIGTTVYSGDGRDCRELIKHADIAMYRAKTRKAL